MRRADAGSKRRFEGHLLVPPLLAFACVAMFLLIVGLAEHGNDRREVILLALFAMALVVAREVASSDSRL
jgi:hypothetical protein